MSTPRPHQPTWHLSHTVSKRAVRILLECFLVSWLFLQENDTVSLPTVKSGTSSTIVVTWLFTYPLLHNTYVRDWLIKNCKHFFYTTATTLDQTNVHFDHNILSFFPCKCPCKAISKKCSICTPHKKKRSVIRGSIIILIYRLYYNKMNNFSLYW